MTARTRRSPIRRAGPLARARVEHHGSLDPASDGPAGARVAVFTDYVYSNDADGIYAQRAFALFLTGLSASFERMVLVGRLHPQPGRSHYRLPSEVEFVPLPYYPTLSQPLRSAPRMLGSLALFWRALARVDSAWLLGPYPLSIAFVALAALRRRRIILGVRQDTLTYLRTRHPGRRSLHLAGAALEAAYRVLAKRYPVIVVGPHLARRYAGGRRVLPISVSLVNAEAIVSPSVVAQRSYDGALQLLSVGRLDREKNPLLLADVLARLHERDDRWRLVVCGEGPMKAELQRRFEGLGVAEHAEVRGYVPLGDELFDLYRSSHAFLHVSWTEGLPQVLFEAFAAGLPVATAVGGVPEAAGGAALLVPPGDPEAASAEVQRLVGDDALRWELITSGIDRARLHTMDAECARVAEFLKGER